MRGVRNLGEIQGSNFSSIAGFGIIFLSQRMSNFTKRVGTLLPTQAVGANELSIWQASPKKADGLTELQKIIKIPANKFSHSALSY